MFTRSVAIDLLRKAQTGADMIKVADMIADEYNNKQQDDVDVVSINGMQHNVDVETQEEGYVKVLSPNGEAVYI